MEVFIFKRNFNLFKSFIFKQQEHRPNDLVKNAIKKVLPNCCRQNFTCKKFIIELSQIFKKNNTKDTLNIA